MTSPHTDPWPATAVRPVRANIKPGDWLVLRNGFVVGPVIETPEWVGNNDVCVTFRGFPQRVGNYICELLTVNTIEDSDVVTDFDVVVFAGSLQHACTYRQQIDLANQIIDEIIAEEQT